MTSAQQDRLAVLRVGARRLAVPLSDVAYFVPAEGQRAVRDAPRWMAGVVEDRGTGTWLPLIDLALLWDDPSLDGPRSHLIVTHAGVAVGASGYATTRGAVPIIALRPGPRNRALRRAALLADDGAPIPVLDAAWLVPPEAVAALPDTP